VRVEQSGSETCEVTANGAFILARVPVRVVGDAKNAKVLSRYHIGGFLGRDTALALRGTDEATLAFRIPRELFREREHLTLQVLGNGETLWAKRYEIRWAKDTPVLEPLSELNSLPREAPPV